MKFGYMCPYNKLGCGESEARERIKYCLNKLGHEVIELDKDNFSFDNNRYAEDLGIDCLLSHCVTEQKDLTFPDIYSCFFYWCPSSFLAENIAIDYITYINKHDTIVGGYESESTYQDLSNTNFFEHDKELLPFCASVPLDWCLEPIKKDQYKLFYVGMDVGKTRYLELIKYLNSKNLIDIYGPESAFGKVNSYKKLDSYKGSIPFDGKSILSKINEAGICLALNSKVHNSVDYVSNRIFEAAAAGAVIICDDNKFNRKYFKDNVFYVDIRQSEDTVISQIKEILAFIEKNPDIAYEMAVKAQKSFKENLALDNYVLKLVDFINEEKEKSNNVANQACIDVICTIDNPNEFKLIQDELNKQYHKNLRLIIISSDEVFNHIKNDIHYEYHHLKSKNSYGLDMIEVFKVVKSPYFLFLNHHCKMHANHLTKLVRSIQDMPFVHSAVYLKKNDGYQTLNNGALNKNILISFIKEDVQSSFAIEEKIIESSVLFSSEFKKYICNNEIVQLSSGIHIYLMLLSIFKNLGNFGFTFASTTGYKNVKSPAELYAKNRYFYNEDGRAKGLLQYELRKIALKYGIYPEKNDFNFDKKFFNNIIRNEMYKELKNVLKIKKVFAKIKKELTFKQVKKEKYKKILNYYKNIINNI